MTTTEKNTYGQILKSSALFGGSSLLNIAIGIVRTKAMAVLLGPAGIGLLGLYGSIADLAHSIAGMGINRSGVRQIAAAVGSGDTARIARTTTVLKRIAILLGLLAAVLLAAFSGQVSSVSFGNEQHAAGVALLSVAVFFRLLSDGQAALIQGMRRIADLAKMGVLGAVYGTFISIGLVYFLGDDGVAPSLVAGAAMGVVTSWWYCRKINTQTPTMTVSQMGQEVAALLKLGFAFMASGLMMMGAAYVIRMIVVRQVGFDAAGLYQSAWALGGLYVAFILQAMGTDFYPRLTAVASDNTACNRIVNEQAQVSLLLAGPGVIATLTFAPLILGLFYTSEFHAAVGVLRWLCLGMALRIISWPMGFIMLAKGAQNCFLWSELAWTVVYLGLAWGCVSAFGLNGTGIAFFVSYVFHCFLNYAIVRRLSSFRWSAANIRAGMLFLSVIAVVFCVFYVLPPLFGTGVGTFAVFISGVYCIRVLLNLVSPDQIPPLIWRLLLWFRLAASSSRRSA